MGWRRCCGGNPTRNQAMLRSVRIARATPHPLLAGRCQSDAIHFSAMSPILLQHWQFTADGQIRTPVLPDGCRDLIVKTDTRGEPIWFVSDLAETTQWVECEAGQAFAGFRLHPAVQIADRDLLAAFGQYDGRENEAQLIGRLEEFVHFNTNLSEVLDALASALPKRDIARRLAVSERTLERLVIQATGKTPLFWKNLARARRAARQLSAQQPLAELAADSGYADQAHMTRDFRKWFGATPGHFLRNTELSGLVRASGHG